MLEDTQVHKVSLLESFKKNWLHHSLSPWNGVKDYLAPMFKPPIKTLFDGRNNTAFLN